MYIFSGYTHIHIYIMYVYTMYTQVLLLYFSKIDKDLYKEILI
jgi:hypothetical protein